MSTTPGVWVIGKIYTTYVYMQWHVWGGVVSLKQMNGNNSEKYFFFFKNLSDNYIFAEKHSLRHFHSGSAYDFPSH